ncbi:DUF3040 domain-containing protein [Luteipulveratus sp. YIM 133132]|uniref:DUF3040 domain-containing protein n=1 Tax=Luteipulveratus flavus TaxID=3031728 RepID=A0ABT6CEU6_9MICO|nr:MULTISPECIES: DUF3040 domain-containing protein [unclassified Luteipulveratus]MDE9366778.1 DUF3040 domain-containing protein [Luteipulveratus sp. YIM 133132]MDF8265811.1 DUF3040 domain-containing protein [Luteipulveratus sp. YIM 133296]
MWEVSKVPLSEHEQRLLDQMEQALYDEDPKFASHMVGDPSRHRTRRKLMIGGAVLVIGLVLVVLGVMSQQIWLGGVGFAVMVGGAGYAVTPTHRRTLGSVGENGDVTLHHQGQTKARKRGAKGSTGSFMDRIEQRWDRRRGQDGW